tara:strand:+ start:2344 stop:2454 length:111 start_codon:yes stop_codon:yes gene_type:complete
MSEALYELIFIIEFLVNIGFKIIILILITMYIKEKK